MADGRNLQRLRIDGIEIFTHALKAVDPVETVKMHLKLEGAIIRVDGKTYSLRDYANIYVIGAGKAGASMAQAIEVILGDRITKGVINVKYGYLSELKRVKLNEAGHPIPDENGVMATQEIVGLLEHLHETDLVICLISGGGSALLTSPAEGISLQDKQKITNLLLECGANINEINAIRKHISNLKGGGLARLAYPSTLIALMLSDVIGDPLDVIASGPTVPDESTFGECMAILRKYNLLGKVPGSIKDRIQRGIKGEIEETPKSGNPIFEKTHNVIIGSNIIAVKAAEQRARELGYTPLILSTFIEGETREVAKVHAAIAKEIVKTRHPIDPPACLISGGETTVTIRGKGLGGRNQEFALASALGIQGLRSVVVISGGTDGTDGPTDAAGAIADGETIRRSHELGLDATAYLEDNDSYHFFKELGDLLTTGPTNTNVMDLRLILVG
ncbi:MAG: glycerate kinase [Syntrophobacterales bacterium]|nr:MAG: glycerate kinase [Syntrophobacterales bacterium]